MNTDSFITFLARGAGPTPRARVTRRIATAVAIGVIASTMLALGAIGPVSANVFATSAPWIKLAYAAGLLLIAVMLTAKLSRPACQLGRLPLGVLYIVVLMVFAGLISLLTTQPEDYLQALLGRTWLVCPWMVLTFSVPSMIAIFWALKELAPTRLRFAGMAAGLVAGASGALSYSLVCPESSLLFVAVWYTTGIALAVGIGAILGPRLMRW